MLLNPVMLLIHNAKLNRWHPAYYTESPLPGPPAPNKPVRHKSGGHHTEGFETREAALARMNINAKQIVDGGFAPSCAICAGYLEWDGEGIPADVAFFKIEGAVATRLM